MELNTRIRDIAQSADGYIYLATEQSLGGAAADGRVLRLEPVPPGTQGVRQEATVRNLRGE